MTPTPLSTLESRVLSAIDPDALVTDVRRLVAHESWGGRETPAQRCMVELMTEAGLEVESWPIDLAAVQEHPAASWEIDRPSALGVTGRLSGTGRGRTLALNGHVDVVPPGDASTWTHPPFAGVVDDGRLYGRGALDMKGPLVAAVHALGAIVEAGVELGGHVRVDSVVGEEDGGIGTLAALLREGPADGAVVLEPTRLAVAPLQAGCLNFRVRVRGHAAHGAVRDEGVSAFEKLFGVYGAISELEERRNVPSERPPLFASYPTPFPISIGTMAGGDWASSVPDHASMEGRMGIRPDETLEEARAALDAAVAAHAATDDWLAGHPPVVEWWGGRFLPAETDPEDAVVRLLADATTDVTGRPTPLEGVPFGADAGLLSTVGGIPTVLFGAGDIRRAHRPDEYVEVDDLVSMARALALFVLRYCA